MSGQQRPRAGRAEQDDGAVVLRNIPYLLAFGGLQRPQRENTPLPSRIGNGKAVIGRCPAGRTGQRDALERNADHHGQEVGVRPCKPGMVEVGVSGFRRDSDPAVFELHADSPGRARPVMRALHCA